MSETILQLDPKLLLVSKLNTRQPTAADVKELAASIEKSGQITPIIARPHPKKATHFEIIAGARRATACKLLGIPCHTIIRKISDDDYLDQILTDNLQREDPDPTQEALLIQLRLKQGASAADIAARYGKSENWVHRRMKLLSIIPKLQEKLKEDLAHFHTVMREFLGSLPEEMQHEVSDSYGVEDVKTLADLKEYVKERDCKLDGATWLDNPASFVPGCGPGCAHSSAEGLFKEDNECATCLNSICFRKRRELATDAAITAALAGNDISAVVCFSENYSQELNYQGAKYKMLYGWQFKEAYKIVKKSADRIGLNLTDPTAPKLVHLRRIEKQKPSSSSGSSAASPEENRVQRVLGKRTAHIVEALLVSLKEVTWDSVCALHNINANEHLIRLTARFGGISSQSYRSSHSSIWNELSEETVEEVSESIWGHIKGVLSQRLGFQKLDDTLTDSFSTEVAKISELIGFDLDAANANAATAVSPKWIQKEGYDNTTLTK
ncbi:ParB/RepB/Spo0J partition protein family [uncultured Caudovirales phage]|uniref:ParB/RepB/Spo0J partition protein family n=1 Tax=uncultured Caudovirales phage TaxID=2100421 RepID=A0A6J5NNP1_9CAUD|nr:ParB/RepB/Spo0J partition protein family [uncultured Caudovirales phage]CAB5224334.1 ParB/RepB/Spo0J partition protein family [uncultured Caudovirales phage]